MKLKIASNFTTKYDLFQKIYRNYRKYIKLHVHKWYIWKSAERLRYVYNERAPRPNQALPAKILILGQFQRIMKFNQVGPKSSLYSLSMSNELLSIIKQLLNTLWVIFWRTVESAFLQGKFFFYQSVFAPIEKKK